jgi:hypothetical protein
MVRATEDVEFNLRKFDINSLNKESIIVLLGKRMTGKSVLIKDILYHKKDIPLGTVISRTDHVQHYYDKFIPSMLIHKQYDPLIIEKVFKRQEKALDEGWAHPHTFLLMDDCLSDAKAFTKDPKIQDIFYNGRHFKILYILAMQSPMGIPPAFRTNIDYTFILKNNNGSDRERIYKNYASMFRSFEEFEIILDNCTEDYNCLVIDNTSNSNKLEDQVFYYKAELHPGFKMCNNNIWAFSNEKYNNTKNFSSNSLAKNTSVTFPTKRGKITIKKK